VLPLSYSESRRGVARKPNLGYFFSVKNPKKNPNIFFSKTLKNCDQKS
jgi:hypothetical protein